MTNDNIWLAEQHATMNALQRLIARLEDGGQDGAVKGAGTTTSRGPVPLELTPRWAGGAGG